MEKEKLFFLQVLADYMNKRHTQVPDNLDWSVLEEIGQAHQLTGVIYHQCKNSIVQSGLPDVEKVKWKRSYMYNFLLYSKRMALLSQIDAEFLKDNIAYLIVKGTEVAKLYPVPALRTMGDSDILVHEGDKQRACDVLKRLGFDVGTSSSREWYAAKNEIKLELHHSLIYDYSVELEAIQAWGNKIWNHVSKQKDKSQCKLDLTYHLIYILLHLRRHLLFEGIGFRQFMDVVILATQPEINWHQADLWFKELKLEKFAATCFTCCSRWFDVKIPALKLELEETFYSESTAKIMNGGVFGSKDKEKIENILFNEMRFSKSSSEHAILKNAFLPYKKMRLLPYCGFLNGRPWLLPIAWGWRLIYRMEKVVPLLKGAYDNETIKKKDDMLTKWGL